MIKARIRPRRPVGMVAFALALPLLLSGCFKFTMDLEVSDQDTISGHAVVAISKELQALADQGDGSEPTDAFSELEDVVATDFDDGTFVGQRYEFQAIPIDELTLDDESSALTIRREGDNLVVSGMLSFEEESSNPDQPDALGLEQAFFDSADLRVSIKFPGEIRETNGEVDAATNTVTWRPKYGAVNELSAVVFSPKGIPAWIWWALGGLLVAVVVGIGGSVLLRRRTGSVQSIADETSVLEAGKSQQTSDGFDRSDRPVFSYVVRTGLFSTEYFELRVYEDELCYGFFTKGGIPSSETTRISMSYLDDVARIEDSSSLGVRVVHSGRVEILPAKAKESKELVALLRSLASAAKSSPTPGREESRDTSKAEQKDAATITVAEDLRRIHDLLTDGIITDAEFEELKKKRIERE